MKNISRWASQHARTAIALLILCETANAANGLLLGMNLLENWSAGYIVLLMLFFLGGALFIQTQSARLANKSYWVIRRWLFGAFMTNCILFTLLGGTWAANVEKSTFTQTALGSRQLVVRSDTIAPSPNLKSTNPAYYETPVSAKEQPVKDQSGKRLGFVLLFLLGIVLTVYAAGLACSLACAGNGTLAFLVGLMGSGIFYGSFVLLSRAFDKIIKPWKLMTRPERKRVYLRSLLLLLGFWVLSALLGGLVR
ncbi:hypothetical protein [Spirosoma aerophilum]